MNPDARPITIDRGSLQGTRLFAKLVLIIIPCFLVVSSVGLFSLAEIDKRDGHDALATRIGNLTARVVSALDRFGTAHIGDSVWQEELPQELLSVMLADQAVRCVELKINKTDEIRLSAPFGLGCAGQAFDQSLDLPVMIDGDHTLLVHFSTEELDAAQQSRREFSLLTLCLGLLIAVVSSWLGFMLIVGRPLGRLMDAIRSGQHGGEVTKIASDRRDELGVVFHAFDDMQTHIADYREHLEDLVDERTQEVERQKLQLEELLSQERELSGLQRQFVAMVSHEFRTPLAIIDGNAQTLLRRAGKLTPERLRLSLGKVRISVKRLIDLMESVLSVARLESGQISIDVSAVSLSDLIREVGTNYAELHQNRRIQIDIDELPDQIIADDKLIRQVISNVISNALKYSPGEGQIWVSGSVDHLNRAVISVRDEGVGIPLAEQERLFERFFRASTSTGIAGSGIGLHLTFHLVQMHEGVIEVESTEGEGTTFYVRLPIDGPKLENALPETASDHASHETMESAA